MKDKTICALLWNHLYLNNDGFSLPCCAAYNHIDEMLPLAQNITSRKNLKNFTNSPLLNDIRETIFEGKKHKFCSSCYENEEKGIHSYRQENNEIFKDTFEKLISSSSSKDVKIKYEYIDLRLGNQCNLACRMCPPNSSSNLIKDHEKLEGRTFSNEFLKNTSWHKDESFWNELLQNSDDLKKIYLAGGEPLIIEETWNFLRSLVKNGNSKNIILYYSTNSTVIPKAAFELWPHFKKIQLSLSIDGTKDSYEYIRYPMKWNKIEKNLTTINSSFQKLNIESAVAYITIQAYNYDSIPKLVTELSKYQNIDSYPIINLLSRPSHLSVHSLPLEVKKNAIGPLKELLLTVATSKYKSIKWKNNFSKEIVNYIDELQKETFNKGDFDKFKKYTFHFDSSRNQNILNRIPELKNFLLKTDLNK